MRIIAGQHRGRKLVGPRDTQTTRPITDRVKESLFSRLLSLGMLGEGNVLDIFCGTGSLGLEALSRGANFCCFVENDHEAGKRLEKNIKNLALEGQTKIIKTNAFTTYWVDNIKADSIRIAFIDPPYAITENQFDLNRITNLMQPLLPKLEDGGVIILRTRNTTNTTEVPDYDGPASFTYGTMKLSFYQRPLN